MLKVHPGKTRTNSAIWYAHQRREHIIYAPVNDHQAETNGFLLFFCLAPHQCHS